MTNAMNASRLLVFVTGLFFGLYGFAFSIFPVEMSFFVTDGSPGTPSGIIDLRASYGGMSVATGLILLICACKPGFLIPGLSIIAILLSAMAGTRLLGMLLDGAPNRIMYLYLVAEIIVAALALYLRKTESNNMGA